MILNIAVGAVCAILTTGFILAAFPAFDVLSKVNLEFCFTSGCFSNAALIFSESIDIIKNSSLIAAYTAAMSGSYIGLKTFNQTINRDNYTRHSSNLSSFKTAIEEIVKSSNISKECLNTNKLYKLIYPNSELGDISISKSYAQTIRKIQSCVELTSSLYGSGNASSQGVRPEHETEMLQLFELLGVTVQEPDLQRIVEIELNVFTFLDKVNATLTGIPEKLSDSRRDYTVAFRTRR